MRPPPPRQVQGSFSPYSTEELNRARSALIDELYCSPGGGRLMYRIRELTGILPNRQGMFVDSANYCEQSSSLLSKTTPENSAPTTKCKEKRTKSQTASSRGLHQDEKDKCFPEMQANEPANGLYTICRQKLQIKIPATVSGTTGTKRHVSIDEIDSENFTDKKRKGGDHSSQVIQIDSDLSCDDFSNSAMSLTVCAFKCDFCDYISESKYMVQNHLVNKVHYLASTYECLSNGGMLTAKYILKEKSLINEAALFTTIVAICDFCQCIFKDIYSCAKHINKTHQKERVYYLGVVRKRQTVIVRKSGKCDKCDQCWTSKLLTKHLRTHDVKDMSYERPQPEDIVYCVCSICNYCFNNIVSCKGHILAHFTRIKKRKATFELLFIRKPTSELQLLPYKGTGKTKHSFKKKGKDRKKKGNMSSEINKDVK